MTLSMQSVRGSFSGTRRSAAREANEVNISNVRPKIAQANFEVRFKHILVSPVDVVLKFSLKLLSHAGAGSERAASAGASQRLFEPERLLTFFKLLSR